jgi:hypothetical protein
VSRAPKDTAAAPPDPDRDRRFVEHVVAAHRQVANLPALFTAAEELGLVLSLAHDAMGEGNSQEHEATAELVERVAGVLPSEDPARATAVEQQAAAEAALAVLRKELDGVTAEYEAAVAERSARAEEAKSAAEAFAQRTARDSKERIRTLMLDAQVASERHALAGAEVDVRKRHVDAAQLAYGAASAALAEARATVARTDLLAEARAMAAAEVHERLDVVHTRRAAWLGKIVAHARETGVTDHEAILIEAGVLEAPQPRVEEPRQECVLQFHRVAQRSIGRALTQEEFDFLTSLDVTIIPVANVFRSADLSGRTIGAQGLNAPLRPIESPSRAPTPTPEGSSTHRVPHAGIVGPTS